MKKVINLIIFCLIYCSNFGYPQTPEIIFIDTTLEHGSEFNQVNFVAKYLGIPIKVIEVTYNNNKSLSNSFFNISEIAGVIITARALKLIDRETLIENIKGKKGNNKALFIVGITSQSEDDVLGIWSDGAIRACNRLSCYGNNGYHRIADDPQICFQLARQEIPFPHDPGLYAQYFEMKDRSNVRSIIDYVSADGGVVQPVLCYQIIDQVKIFYQIIIFSNDDLTDQKIWKYDVTRFMEIAPIMMFLKWIFGEYCWHAPKAMANLTIDDPWLKNEYGYLNFNALLTEMKLYNFHTTIAFIPWNYDRNDSETVDLFLNNSDRYSICIHGNNHNHREFGGEDVKGSERKIQGYYQEQEKDIVQALARMERFKKITGISYGKIMVFPHGIATYMSLSVLKKYNFLATANSRHIPTGIKLPDSQQYMLSNYNIFVNNFLSFRRSKPLTAESLNLDYKVAIDLFLNNPIIFYTHHSFFRTSISNFNLTAQVVNSIESKIEWVNLTKLVQYAYQIRKRNGKSYDINLYSTDFILENCTNDSATYFVQKQESQDPKIEKVILNGEQIDCFEVDNGLLNLIVTLPPHERGHIIIEYESEFDANLIDISKSTWSVNILRYISDFRDNTLSRIKLLSSFIDWYYESNLNKNLNRIIFILIITITLMTFIILLKYIRRNKQRI
ncbi:MAG: hypothetical protein ACOY90_22630 [Candidatus Zhuqueibacterota bacterium]